MRILRSQYLKLHNNAGNHGILKNMENGKGITNKGKALFRDKEIVNVVQTPSVLLRKKNIDCFDATSSLNATNIKISINNFDETMKNLKVVVEFTDMNALWLTQIYKTYENDLWHKKPRTHDFGNKKFMFYCGLCSNVYKEFRSIKSHLNLHLDFYPYVCKLCSQKYTNRKSATDHLRRIHNLNKEQWNNFLTS